MLNAFRVRCPYQAATSLGAVASLSTPTCLATGRHLLRSKGDRTGTNRALIRHLVSSPVADAVVSVCLTTTDGTYLAVTACVYALVKGTPGVVLVLVWVRVFIDAPNKASRGATVVTPKTNTPAVQVLKALACTQQGCRGVMHG